MNAELKEHLKVVSWLFVRMFIHRRRYPGTDFLAKSRCNMEILAAFRRVEFKKRIVGYSYDPITGKRWI